MFNNLVQGFKDMAVELDRYNPPLRSLIQQSQKNKLSTQLYPFYSNSCDSGSDITIVYIVGGTTYVRTCVLCYSE